MQRWVVILEREGFHLKTRSDMKQLLEDDKWMVLSDKSNLLRSVHSLSFEWMCGAGRTISPRTEQREQVWVTTGVIPSLRFDLVPEPAVHKRILIIFGHFCPHEVFPLRTVVMSSDFNLCLALVVFVPSASVQAVSSSFLSGKRKMGLGPVPVASLYLFCCLL